jgi:two-component system sensor histidine kinase/response regulator
VDDNPTNRRVTQDYLAQAGAAPEGVAGAAAALTALRSAAAAGRPFRLLVSDVHMPGRDGFDLARDVRGDPALADTRIMLLTSGGRRGDGERCRELGVAAYLLKPVSRVELLESASTVMAGPLKPETRTPALVTRHSIRETHRALSILLAEDSRTNQQVAVAMLRKRGHRVEAVENGRQAVEAVRTGRYDVVLMDIQMPEMDGFAATRAIRQLLGGRPLPIVALTANVLCGERERCLAEGMDGYLGKPFRAHELFAAVEGWDEMSDGAPPPSDAGSRAPVDLEAFRAALREAGVEEATEDVLATFRGDAPGRMADLEAAVAARHAGAVTRAAHAYKSAAASIHADALALLLAEMEAAGRMNNLETAAELLERVRQAHGATTGFLAARSQAAV